MGGAQRQSRFERGEDVVVMKFGGTSVEDAAAIRRLIDIVEGRLGAKPVLIISALAKVTDQLLEAGNAAANGHLGSALAGVRNIYVRHEELADSLLSGSAYGSLDRHLRGEFQSLESFLHHLERSHYFDLKAQDRLLSFGECFSSRLVSWALCEAGLQAAHVDARSCIVTDAHHGQASPRWDVTNQRLRDVLNPLLQSGAVPVLGGFMASTSDGVPTTLGRGGSDFSAAIVGAAIGASRVEIWTDVDGVMTTDPKICSDAHVIRKLSFDEAADLAHFGAKVLHPATLAPAMRENIPVYVLNSRHPEGNGTEITARASTGNRVSAITAKRSVVSLEIQSRRGVDAALLNAVFGVLEQHNCAVDVMATSIDRISLLVGSSVALPKIVEDVQQVADVRWENHKALVCLVGENIRRQPEVASQLFATISDMDVRILCQGASERTLSFLVDESKAEESVRRLHSVFFPRLEPARDWGGISSAFCEAG
ncbi:MAG TPA: aspartate kinase [Candidatus Sulfotelmatobacter sp.]|nr:aspartate kinase [Candidatus Sulfotelmatobacter sp.]